MIFFSNFDSPFGTMSAAVTERGVLHILFPEEYPFNKTLSKYYKTDKIIESAKHLNTLTKQFHEYFNKQRKYFDINLDFRTSGFYKKALTEVARIPYGKTASYGEIAARVSNPKAARAVGTANAKNPLPIIIPCHRVIAGDGSLGGYGGKLERKMFLLELEGVF